MMSGRSSARDAIAVAVLLACVAGCHRRAREADPAKFLVVAERMVANVPTPAAIRDCRPDELVGATMTRRTLLLIAHRDLDTQAELADWMNPDELDAAPARVLADPKATDEAKRRATAELLAAPAYFTYKLDMVAAPMALGVKDLKIGTVGGRLFRYDKTGRPECVVLYVFQNDKQKSDRAIELSRASGVIDPAVARELREDLHAQYLAHAPKVAAKQ
jgi:hypothetical protein